MYMHTYSEWQCILCNSKNQHKWLNNSLFVFIKDGAFLDFIYWAQLYLKAPQKTDVEPWQPWEIMRFGIMKVSGTYA